MIATECELHGGMMDGQKVTFDLAEDGFVLMVAVVRRHEDIGANDVKCLTDLLSQLGKRGGNEELVASTSRGAFFFAFTEDDAADRAVLPSEAVYWYCPNTGYFRPSLVVAREAGRPE